MDVKYQVFVSSTYTDLIEERRKVTEAILNLGHIPIGMEAFQASDDTQWDYIKRRIDDSDYYVVIVAERYGSESDGKSYTQMEYEYAVEKGVPVAAFLLETGARKTWPNELVEHEKKRKVEKFRSLCQKKLCKHWKNADDLGSKVILALSELTREKPRTGWVKASELPSSNVLDEIARLSEEKRGLSERLAALDESDTLKIPDHAAWRMRRFLATRISDIMYYNPLEQESDLLALFKATADTLAEGCRAEDVKENIETYENIEYEGEAAEGFLRELVSNNLVRVEKFFPNGYGGEEIRTYYLSDYGKEFLMYAREQESRDEQKHALKVIASSASQSTEPSS